MGVFSKALSVFRGGMSRQLSRARREEAAGRLEDAVASYLEAGARDEAARVYLVRAELAPQPLERYQLLGQARALAAPPLLEQVAARRGELVLELVRQGTLVLTRTELRALGEETQAAGCAALAAELFALAGDVEAQTAMLIEAGAIEQLEQVLGAEQERERALRRAVTEVQRVLDFDRCGRRRDALAAAAELDTNDERVLALVRRIEERRVSGPRAVLALEGRSSEVVFGQSVVIGRADCEVVIASPALSRRHAELRRSASGIEVRDLGSRNGTTLRGIPLGAPLDVGGGVELVLGGQVKLTIEPAAGAGLRLLLGDRSILVPLGPLAVDRFRLMPASDGWLELTAAEPPFLGGLRADPVVQLCRGDAVSLAPSGPTLLEVLE